MPYPTTDEHQAATGRRLEIQTDKAAFKIVPCTYAGCNTDLVVNTFYAPAKGKCSQHNGKSSSEIATSTLIHASPDAPANGALANLQCPICKMPMAIISISDTGRFVVFACTDGAGVKLDDAKEARALRPDGFCGTSVEVRIDWAALEMGKIPTRLLP